MICFTLAAALAVTFVTAAGTAILAGHCGRMAADDPFSLVRTVLEKRAAERDGPEKDEIPDETAKGGVGEARRSSDGEGLAKRGAAKDMEAAAEVSDEDGEKDARLTALTARAALITLCVSTVVVTAAFVIRGRKK